MYIQAKGIKSLSSPAPANTTTKLTDGDGWGHVVLGLSISIVHRGHVYFLTPFKSNSALCHSFKVLRKIHSSEYVCMHEKWELLHMARPVFLSPSSIYTCTHFYPRLANLLHGCSFCGKLTLQRFIQPRIYPCLHCVYIYLCVHPCMGLWEKLESLALCAFDSKGLKMSPQQSSPKRTLQV